ncbi:MAG: response regulator [Pyrinomonadaceae bacterium]
MLFGGKTEKTLNKKILCVEDHQDTCELYELLLPEYDLTFAKSVAQAIAFFEQNYFDLGIMDGRLCDGSGVDLCRKMLELKPDFPVIFVSGLARDNDIEAAKKAGASAYLTKPCDMDELQKIVKELIEKQQSEKVEK